MRQLLSLGAKISIGFLFALVLLAVISVIAYRNTRALIETSRWVAHTQEVLATLETVLSQLQDTETGQRGYLLTGEEPYLEPYRAGVSHVHDAVQKLQRLTADDPGQQQRLSGLESLITQKLAELQETIQLRATAGLEAATAVVRTDRGKQIMDQARMVVQEMEDAERRLLSQRTKEAETGAHRTLAVILYSNALAFLLVALAGAAVSRDLTKRRQAEQALAALNAQLEHRVVERTAELQRSQEAERAQREYFQVTLASIGDAAIVTDPQGEVTFLNREAEVVTGWTTTDAIGKPLAEVFPIQNEETHQPVESPVAKVLRTGTVAGLANHTVLVKRDGSACPIDDSAAPIRDEHGKLLGIILVFRDITERRQAEVALQASEARFRTLAEALPALVWMARPDGFLDYYNQRWYDYTGQTTEQLAGWGWEAAWHPKDLPEGRARWQESLRTGKPYEYEARFRRAADGSFRWQLIRAMPLRDQAGRVLRWFGTNIDIEEQKHAAAELQRVNGELQQFTYIVSHDLQEPLRTTGSFVQLLASRYKGQLDATADEYIAFAVDGVKRMQQLITDLLAYTRIDSQKQNVTTVDCESLLARALDNLRLAITESGAEIDYS